MAPEKNPEKDLAKFIPQNKNEGGRKVCSEYYFLGGGGLERRGGRGGLGGTDQVLYGTGCFPLYDLLIAYFFVAVKNTTA